jgi:hypothetical protein
MHKVNKAHTLVLIIDFNTEINSNTTRNIGPFNEMISISNMNSSIQHKNPHTYNSSAKYFILDYTHIICNQKIT